MGILESIAAFLLILWLIGFILHIGGVFIHILIIVAIVVFLLRFLKRS